MDPEAAILAIAAFQHWQSLNRDRCGDPPPPPRPRPPLTTPCVNGPPPPAPSACCGIDPKRDPALFAGPRMERC